MDSESKAEQQVTIVVKRVCIKQLRAQRNKLLEFINPSEEIEGLINLLDHMLDVAEGFNVYDLPQMRSRI